MYMYKHLQFIDICTNSRQEWREKYVKYFVMTLKEISFAHYGCIYLFKNKGKTVLFWNIITI